MEILFRSICTLFLFLSVYPFYTPNFLHIELYIFLIYFFHQITTCWRDLILSSKGTELTVRRNKCLFLITSKIYILPEDIYTNLMTRTQVFHVTKVRFVRSVIAKLTDVSNHLTNLAEIFMTLGCENAWISWNVCFSVIGFRRVIDTSFLESLFPFISDRYISNLRLFIMSLNYTIEMGIQARVENWQTFVDYLRTHCLSLRKPFGIIIK